MLVASTLRSAVENGRRPCEPGKGTMTCHRVRLAGCVGIAAVAVFLSSFGFAQTPDPGKPLAEADRLAWLTNWYDALPIYAEVEQAATKPSARSIVSSASVPNPKVGISGG